MSNKLLTESQWAATKERITEGLKGSRKRVMDITMDNYRRERALFESATAGATTAGNIASVNKVILPIMRRV